MRYPLGEYEKEKIVSKTGKKLTDITLEEVMKNHVGSEDIKISKKVLYAQGQIAENIGNIAIRRNLERAAELVDVPDDVILKMYDKLRPNRSTKKELLQMADQLAKCYKAEQCAKLVLEAADIYEKRGILL